MATGKWGVVAQIRGLVNRCIWFTESTCTSYCTPTFFMFLVLSGCCIHVYTVEPLNNGHIDWKQGSCPSWGGCPQLGLHEVIIYPFGAWLASHTPQSRGRIYWRVWLAGGPIRDFMQTCSELTQDEQTLLLLGNIVKLWQLSRLRFRSPSTLGGCHHRFVQ